MEAQSRGRVRLRHHEVPPPTSAAHARRTPEPNACPPSPISIAALFAADAARGSGASRSYGRLAARPAQPATQLRILELVGGSLLDSSRGENRARKRRNAAVRIAVLRQLQHTHGNRAVQRFLGNTRQ